MAKLPLAIEQDAPQGERPSTDTVAPTDLGLNRQDLAPVAAAFEARDRKAAEPALLKLQGDNETAYAADAAAYTGAQPGFAADQIAKAQARAVAASHDPSLSGGVRHQLQQLTTAEVARVGEQAIAHEAQVRAQPIADAVAAQKNVQLNNGLTGFLTSYAPAKQQVLDSFDGSTSDLDKTIAAKFDASAATALAATPDALKPALQNHLAAMRTQEVAGALEIQGKTHDDYILKNTNDQASAQINAISSSPLAYDNVVANGLPSVVANLPAKLQAKALREYTGEAATARIKALIDQDNPKQARAELNDGRYDQFLDPKAKEALETAADSALRRTGPQSFEQYVAAGQLKQRAEAETFARLSTGQSTGQVNLDQVAAALGPAEAARYQQAWQAADRTFATVGHVRSMSNAQVAATAAAAEPRPTEPDYANKVVQWQVASSAAAAEMKARAEPGTWAWTPSGKGRAGLAGVGAAQDSAAQLHQLWSDTVSATGSDRTQVGARYAGTMISTQMVAGTPLEQVQILPQAQAASLAANVINAPPAQKLQAMQSLAALMGKLPVAYHISDGGGATVTPRAILARQLAAAHLSPVELSAITDYGDDPAKLGRVVAALNDPSAKKALPDGDEKRLQAGVRAGMASYLKTVAPLPDDNALNQARLDRTALVARGLVLHQGMSPSAAVQTAAQDAIGAYRFVDTWRMPQALAGGRAVSANGNVSDGAGLVRSGAAKVLATLLSDRGANLYAPVGQRGGPDDRRRLFASQISMSGRWVTTPDDTGLMLMVPHGDGGYDPVPDRYGRPVRASWSDLTAQAKGAPAMFAAPPLNVVRTPAGAPLPAVSKTAAFSALAYAVTSQESHGQDGLTSPRGALGRMQVMPPTAQDYAPRVFHAPLDLDRLKNDGAYNQRLGEAILQDQVNHYGQGAGLGLALVAYNAGRGRLEGWTDPATNIHHQGWLTTIGDPRTGRISLTDFVNRIPYKETREYVQQTLPRALTRLQANH